MANNWDEVPGWFNFPQLYRRIIERLPDGATFVEVGVWCGKSLIFFLDEMIKAGKKIKVYGIEWGFGSDEDVHRSYMAALPHPNILSELLCNLRVCGVYDHVTIIASTSEIASQLFADYSVDACFVDADHHYESAKKDLALWFRKIKLGGMLAGHDLYTPDVNRAITDTFGTFESDPSENVWWVNIPGA
jgi:cephalosporin hydroxylase